RSGKRSFQLEQSLFSRQPAAVAGEAAARADDSVAREHDRDRVAVHDRPDGARGTWMLGAAGQLAVRRQLAVRNVRELVEHAAREARADAEVDREVELPAPMLEVLVELPPRLVDASRRAEHANADGA